MYYLCHLNQCKLEARLGRHGYKLSMGNKPSINCDPESPSWTPLSSSNDRRLWRHPHTGQELEEFTLTDLHSPAEYMHSFTLRHNSQVLIAGRYLHQHQEQQLCSSSRRASLYLENIVLRLSQIGQVPYPDIIHLYSQTLRGFQDLSRHLGYFEVDEELVGVNRKGEVKVWCHRRFDEIKPEVKVGGKTLLQEEMVVQVIRMVDRNSNASVVPQSFRRCLLRHQNEQLGFKTAIARLEEYVRERSIQVPQCLLSVRELLRIGGVCPLEVVKMMDYLKAESRVKANCDLICNQNPHVGVTKESLGEAVTSPKTSSVSQERLHYGILPVPTLSTDSRSPRNLSSKPAIINPEVSYQEVKSPAFKPVGYQLPRQSDSHSHNQIEKQPFLPCANTHAPQFTKPFQKHTYVVPPQLTVPTNKHSETSPILSSKGDHTQFAGLPTGASFQMNTSLSNNNTQPSRFLTSPSRDNLSSSLPHEDIPRLESPSVTTFRRKLLEMGVRIPTSSHPPAEGEAKADFQLKQQNVITEPVQMEVIVVSAFEDKEATQQQLKPKSAETRQRKSSLFRDDQTPPDLLVSMKSISFKKDAPGNSFSFDDLSNLFDQKREQKEDISETLAMARFEKEFNDEMQKHLQEGGKIYQERHIGDLFEAMSGKVERGYDERPASTKAKQSHLKLIELQRQIPLYEQEIPEEASVEEKSFFNKIEMSSLDFIDLKRDIESQSQSQSLSQSHSQSQSQSKSQSLSQSLKSFR